MTNKNRKQVVLLAAIAAAFIATPAFILSKKAPSSNARSTPTSESAGNHADDAASSGSPHSSLADPSQSASATGQANASPQPDLIARPDAQTVATATGASQNSSAPNTSSSDDPSLPPADLIADVLAAAGELTDPQKRAETAARIRAIEDLRYAAAVKKANELGLPITGVNDSGNFFALRDFENGRALYDETNNVNAAISTNAARVRDTDPYKLTGTGMTAGIWEPIGIALTTHQEFGTRVTNGDASDKSTEHATHTAGTIIASGVDAKAKGMAPSAKLRAYNTTNATSEMTTEGAATATDTDAIPLSNHSYGTGGIGWGIVDGIHVWYGTFSDDSNPANDYETDFGRYNSSSANMDSLVVSLPYYLPFFSAGNAANNGPANGGRWKVAGSTTEYAYDPAIHPPRNNSYKGGYDHHEGNKLAKNVISIGAANDAITPGTTTRNPANGTITSFSSRGPADDGRIKPDIVANGASLYSTTNTSNTSYTSLSGTSMASPNAAGSALLLQQLYKDKNDGRLMRASTLKALLIHTANDLGTAGPDYTYGWGLMNTFQAAEVIRQDRDTGLDGDIIQQTLNSTTTSRTYTFKWPADKPIKVTLCWTDPAGATDTTHDNRTADLINNLNLTVTDSTGKVFYPYIMPYVGDWTVAKIDDAATTGVNNTDNVEQINIPARAADTYRVKVSYSGTLQDNQQAFSLIVTGFNAR